MSKSRIEEQRRETTREIVSTLVFKTYCQGLQIDKNSYAIGDMQDRMHVLNSRIKDHDNKILQFEEKNDLHIKWYQDLEKRLQKCEIDDKIEMQFHDLIERIERLEVGHDARRELMEDLRATNRQKVQMATLFVSTPESNAQLRKDVFDASLKADEDSSYAKAKEVYELTKGLNCSLTDLCLTWDKNPLNPKSSYYSIPR